MSARGQPAATQPIDPARIPSIDLIEATLDREEESYRSRAGGIDTKAGVILGAAGVLVALVGTHPSVAGLVGQLLALTSGAAAVAALWPKIDKAIGPERLRDRYLTVDVSITRMVVLNSRIDLHAKDEQRLILILKANRVRASSVLLLASAMAVVAGGTVAML